MQNGFIKLYRKIIENGLLQSLSPNTFKVFIWSLLKASHKKHEFYHGTEKISLLPGQFVTGRKKACEELGISQQSFRTAIKTLKKLKILTNTPTKQYTVITIEKWEKYQDGDKKVTNNLTNNLTNTQPTPNQHLTTYKNDKNDKNEKNNIIAPNKNSASVESSRFFTTRNKSSSSVKPQVIKMVDFSYDEAKWCIHDIYMNEMIKMYPEIDVELELRKMKAWLLADGRRAKKNYKRFVINWLNKALSAVKEKEKKAEEGYEEIKFADPKIWLEGLK